MPCFGSSLHPNPLFFLSVLILTFFHDCGTALSNDILGFDIPTEPNLDANTVCKTYPDLTPEQYYLCAKSPDVAASAIQGVQIAVHECQFQFRAHRWNCSDLETKNKNPHSSPLMRRGFKESAYAYAVTAGGMFMQVSQACAMGKLLSCGCSAPQHDERTRTWSWDGCDNNNVFADRFTKKFLASKEEAKDLQSQIIQHNNKVGRNLVKRNLRTECKCHGFSGSCEFKTCWQSPPHIRHLGAWLKEKYLIATKVDNTNSAAIGKLRPLQHAPNTRRKRRRVNKDELVFFENSPNFCEHTPSLDNSGTRGRICNKTASTLDNCETLCCGRGYNTLRVTRTERCHCRFHWCCYVVCQQCTFDEWVTVCK